MNNTYVTFLNEINAGAPQLFHRPILARPCTLYVDHIWLDVYSFTCRTAFFLLDVFHEDPDLIDEMDEHVLLLHREHLPLLQRQLGHAIPAPSDKHKMTSMGAFFVLYSNPNENC